MSKIGYIVFLTALIVYSCKREPNVRSVEQSRKEILEAEQNFAKMVEEEGMYQAFITFAADDAVLMRNNDLVIGKSNIDSFYKNRTSKNLSWKPDFIEVSESGDLGYTYGHYIFFTVDSIGNSVENKGVFHTVWKRQGDGTWKYVWD